MTSPVSIYKLASSSVAIGGMAVTVGYGPLLGGFITNPASAADQGISGPPEILYVDPTGAPAALHVTETTVALQAGASFTFAPNQTTNISVNAATAGHKFSGIVVQPQTQYPPTPQVGTFPPIGPTTLTSLGAPGEPVWMGSFLYQEYADDDNLQAFVAAFNSIANEFVAFFATVLLPVYTNPQISGALLDWVAEGVYGMIRPALSSNRNRDVGPFNTWAYNKLGFNVQKLVGPRNLTVTSDDVFKRIMTWNFYKGDGNVFNVRWLKRRIKRFLTGPNGTAPNVDQTDDISVTYGPGIIAVRLSFGQRTITGGALFNRFGYNRMAFNALQTVFASGPSPPMFANVLQEAIESGVLILPFQYEVVIRA
jgi:hypothetical protein